MSEMSYYLLSTERLHKKTRKSRLKHFPAGYVGNFYRNLADNVDNFLGSNFYGRIANDFIIPLEDVQKYILATSDFAKGMQTGISHYVMRVRINKASFREKLDPISKIIIRRQNPLELVFKDISTFDAETPIVGSIIGELDVGKEDVASDLIKKAPKPLGLDISLRNRLEKLKNWQEPKYHNDLSPPPSIPRSIFPSVPPQPPSLFPSVPPPPPSLPPPPRFIPPTWGRFLDPF